MIEGCARLLEVMIITEKKKALLILGGELYSRLLSSDEHYEKTVSVNKENTPESSLRSIDTRYENIEMNLIDDDNSKTVVLRTKTMNVLFTSSIRLDNSDKQSLVYQALMDLSRVKKREFLWRSISFKK